MLEIKEVGATKAALIAQLSRQTFAETFSAFNKPEDMQLFFDQQFTEAALIAEVGQPQHRFFIAHYNNEAAGYLKISVTSHEAVPDSMEISRIYVTQQMVGKKVGAALMQHAVDTATALARKALWLGVWEHNHRALQFYNQWGFVPFGEQPFLLGTDLQRDLLLKKIV